MALLNAHAAYTVARVKKIINADDNIHSCSNNAAFVITVAAEMFMHYLTERTYDVVKSERKPRRNIQYKDVGKLSTHALFTSSMANKRTANAVARFDNLEFLSDVVPRTVTYKEYKQKQAKPTSGQSLENGQATLDGPKPKLDEIDEEIDDGATEEDIVMEEAPEENVKSKGETKEVVFREYQGPHI